MPMIDTDSAEFKEKYISIDDAKAATESEVEGLKNKNKELLGKNKKLSVQVESYDGLEPDEVKDKLGQLNELIEKGASTEESYKRLLKESEDNLKKKLTKADTRAAALETKLRDTLASDALNKSLLDVKVDPRFMPAAKALLSGKVSVDLDGEEHNIAIGGEPLGDFVKTWSQGDEGKHFLAAPDNSGGGAGGGGRQTATGEAGKLDFSKSNRELAEQLKASREE
jgi:hypothetical protein